LFQYLAIERVRYETTVGTGGIDQGFAAIDADDNKIKAQMFDTIAAVYVPPFIQKLFGQKPSDTLIGPAFRLRSDVYNGQLVQTQDKIVIHDTIDDSQEEVGLASPSGQAHRFVTEFYQVNGGISGDGIPDLAMGENPVRFFEVSSTPIE
jgi:hypothetical protein